MPKLRKLSGGEVIAILGYFGFVVIRVKGTHHRLRRTVEGKNQHLTVPVHGNNPLPTGTLRAIYRQAINYIPESKLRPYFHSAD